MPVSDAVIPQPIVQTGNCYMGDYDYWQADGNSVQGSWTDSRGVGSGGTQDVFHDDIASVVGTSTPTPTGTSPPTHLPTRRPVEQPHLHSAQAALRSSMVHLDPGDLTMTDRLFRDGIVAECPTSKTFPGTINLSYLL